MLMNSPQVGHASRACHIVVSLSKLHFAFSGPAQSQALTLAILHGKWTAAFIAQVEIWQCMGWLRSAAAPLFATLR